MRTTDRLLRVAGGRLDLDHVGAEISKLEGQHVAGDQPGKIERAHACERALCPRIEGDLSQRSLGQWICSS